MRTKPYTSRGISRVPCKRCGKPSKYQWQICSDQRQYRGICAECDLLLNETVLKLLNFEDWEEKMKWYKEKVANE